MVYGIHTRIRIPVGILNEKYILQRTVFTRRREIETGKALSAHIYWKTSLKLEQKKKRKKSKEKMNVKYTRHKTQEKSEEGREKSCVDKTREYLFFRMTGHVLFYSNFIRVWKKKAVKRETKKERVWKCVFLLFLSPSLPFSLSPFSFSSMRQWQCRWQWERERGRQYSPRNRNTKLKVSYISIWILDSGFSSSFGMVCFSVWRLFWFSYKWNGYVFEMEYYSIIF